MAMDDANDKRYGLPATKPMIREDDKRYGLPATRSTAGEKPSSGAEAKGSETVAPAQARGATRPTGQPDKRDDKPLLPALSVPKGGGAIRGIGEKLNINAATGTASLSIPLPVSPGRNGFGPEVGLGYDSGHGNGPFGMGMALSVPSITRKTDKGLPRYYDAEESDEYILSGAEDLVPNRSPPGPAR